MNLNQRVARLEGKAAKCPPQKQRPDLGRLSLAERQFLDGLSPVIEQWSDAELREAERLLSYATAPTATAGHGSTTMAAGCDCGECEATKRYMQRSNELHLTPAQPEG